MTTIQVQEEPVRNAPIAHSTVMTVLFVISFSHMLNDTIQALLPSIYPMLRDSFHLSFGQLGWITFTFQCTASLFQPLVGMVTDKRPMPHSLAVGMGLTLVACLRWRSRTAMRSSSFRRRPSAWVRRNLSSGSPRAWRTWPLVTRRSFAQSVFQLGGNAGQRVGAVAGRVDRVSRGRGGGGGRGGYVAWFFHARVAGRHCAVENRHLAESRISIASATKILRRRTRPVLCRARKSSPRWSCWSH